MSFTVTPSGTARTRGLGTPVPVLVGRSDFLSQLEDDVNDVFFNQSEFGETLDYYHATLDEWTTYRSIFDNPHTSMQFGAGAEFNSLKPQVQVQESKLLHPIGQEDLIKMRGVRYTVEDFISDGVGITTIYMHRTKQ